MMSDGRQKFLSLRSHALAGRAALLAAFLGLTIAVAVRAAVWWPFAIILAITSFAYLFGLSTYGTSEGESADDASAGYEAPSPVSR